MLPKPRTDKHFKGVPHCKGQSNYEINSGDCFKFERSLIYNRKLRTKTLHDTYIWVQYVGGIPKNKIPSRRRLTIATINVPYTGDLKKTLVRVRRVERHYVALLLYRREWEKVATKVFFNSTDASWIRFYRKVGIIPNEQIDRQTNRNHREQHSQNQKLLQPET